MPVSIPPGILKEKGTRMREDGERRERTENEARHELRRILRLRRASHGADDVAIPDYVMRDFGSPDGSRDSSNGGHHAPESSDEDFARGRE